MTKKISIVLCVLALVGGCSSAKKVDPLDENLVFDEEQSDLVQGLDFDDDTSDDEEFKALDDAEDTAQKSSEKSDDFSAFDKNESDDDGDTDFALFDDEVKKPEVEPPAFEFDTAANEDDGFESPFEASESTSDDGDFFSPPVSSNEKPNTVLSVDYNALQNGGSFVVSTTDTPFYETEFIPETNQYVLKLTKSQIGKKLTRPFLTKDFRQSFEAMNSYKGNDESVKFVFQLKPNSFPKVSRLGNKILIEPGLRPSGSTKQNSLMNQEEDGGSLTATSFEDFLLDKNNYVGQKVSLQVKEESVVTIIQFISEQVGANIVISESVKGKLSIKLKDVPWDQALISIMKTKGLGYVRSGNILRVATLAELRAESKAAAEIQTARKTLAPFHTKVFPLSYAKPQELETKLKPFLTTANGAAGRTGQIISEARSSSLMVRDTLEVIKNIASLVKELDRPPLQVMIQAKIVEATKNFKKEIESLFTSSANNNTNSSQFNGRAAANWRGAAGDAFFVPEVSLSGINFLGTLTARLRLQELESNVKILSAPSIMAINNQKSSIVQNDQIVNVTVVTADENVTESPEFRDVKLSLDVTPQVTSDSNIIMDIDVKREFPVPAGNFVSVSSRTATTKVIIGNNLTGMIGGIYQVNESKSETGTPYLRKIPLIKWLFNNSEYSKLDTELVIFITPRIIGPTSIGGKIAAQKLKPEKGTALTQK